MPHRGRPAPYALKDGEVAAAAVLALVHFKLGAHVLAQADDAALLPRPADGIALLLHLLQQQFPGWQELQTLPYRALGCVIRAGWGGRWVGCGVARAVGGMGVGRAAGGMEVEGGSGKGQQTASPCLSPTTTSRGPCLDSLSLSRARGPYCFLSLSLYLHALPPCVHALSLSPLIIILPMQLSSFLPILSVFLPLRSLSLSSSLSLSLFLSSSLSLSSTLLR